MSTTVPQNISKTNVGGRHKPTRSSLRHSRMLVLKNMEGTSFINLKTPLLSISLFITLIFLIIQYSILASYPFLVLSFLSFFLKTKPQK